jgi:hypothetical protein
MTKKRIAMNVLWCLVGAFAFFCWQIIKQPLVAQKREEIVAQRIAEFQGNSPSDWAVIAESCRAYLETKRGILYESEIQPSLSPDLTQLHPHYWEVRDGRIEMEWSDDFFGSLASLEYRVEDGKGSLWFSCDKFNPHERRVWLESAPSE